jgi:hypothetical protein
MQDYIQLHRRLPERHQGHESHSGREASYNVEEVVAATLNKGRQTANNTHGIQQIVDDQAEVGQNRGLYFCTGCAALGSREPWDN